jgi:hypothetical protein
MVDDRSRTGYERRLGENSESGTWRAVWAKRWAWQRSLSAYVPMAPSARREVTDAPTIRQRF